MPQPINYSNYQVPKGESAFLTLEPGDNRIRIASEPAEVVLHEITKDGKWATQECEGEACELCAKGKPKKFKYAYRVINRKDGKVYIYEAPAGVFRSIQDYALNEEYGDPTEYDITITKRGEKLNTTYQIIASPKKSVISDEEAEMLETSDVTIEKAYEKKV